MKPTTRADRIAFWRKMVNKYSRFYNDGVYYAQTERPHPKVDHVEHLFSGCFEPGATRYWAFNCKEARDLFCLSHEGAKPCSNPTIDI